MKAKVIQLADENVNDYYSIRDPDLPSTYPALFTAKYFYDWEKEKGGFKTTEYTEKCITIATVQYVYE